MMEEIASFEKKKKDNTRKNYLIFSPKTWDTVR
jgi:hypothetical protein